MSADVIRLLPDALANQIAAGEVIQRPASVVKELLENAIDAGATKIMVHVREAGRQLIQVVDNGSGMSDMDTRMAVERHATSKIVHPSDLNAIRTLGFRGEALASIAAVSQLEIKSRRHDSDIGSHLVIEATDQKRHEPCATAPGTTIWVKNLFFNVPARRKFLKGNPVELRHIAETFQRVALAHPLVHMQLFHNDAELASYPGTNLRQRVSQVFGMQSNKKLIPVAEETDIVRISGFVGKPEYARRTRGEQYLFVNQRFIRNPYLQHAIQHAFDEVLAEGTFPLYVIYLEVDPSEIDVNIHPTKQEVKFGDESILYGFLKVAVRHAVARYGSTGSLDFEVPVYLNGNQDVKPAFPSHPGQGFASPGTGKAVLQQWERLFTTNPATATNFGDQVILREEVPGEGILAGTRVAEQMAVLAQVHRKYILCEDTQGVLLVDQQAAHERVLFERFLAGHNDQAIGSQKVLFPLQLELPPADAILLESLLPGLAHLGFDIVSFGQHSFLIHGVPEGIEAAGEPGLVELLLEQYKNDQHLKLPGRDRLYAAMARAGSLKRGKSLSQKEMQVLVDALLSCEVSWESPSGARCFLRYTLPEIDRKFKN